MRFINATGKVYPEFAHSNVRRVLVMKAVMGTQGLITPTLALLWKQCGLELDDIMKLEAMFAVTTALLMVPAGYVSDLFGRRRCMIAAAVGYTVGFVLYAVANNFQSLLAAEVVLAMAMSLMFGSEQALVFDSLKELGVEHLHAKVRARGQTVFQLTLTVACVIGGLLGAVNLRYPAIVLACCAGGVLVCAAGLTDPKVGERRRDGRGLRELRSVIVDSLVVDRRLGWFIVFAACMSAFTQAGLWFYTPYFKLCGIDVVFFGFIYALFNLVSAVSGEHSKRLEQWVGFRFSAVMLAVMLAAGYLLLGSVVVKWSFLFILLHQWARGFGEVLFSDYLNQVIGSTHRGTVNSILGCLRWLVYAGVVTILGEVGRYQGVPEAFYRAGIMAAGAGVLLLVLHAAISRKRGARDVDGRTADAFRHAS